jgi:hypothetical protein
MNHHVNLFLFPTAIVHKQSYNDRVLCVAGLETSLIRSTHRSPAIYSPKRTIHDPVTTLAGVEAHKVKMPSIAPAPPSPILNTRKRRRDDSSQLMDGNAMSFEMQIERKLAARYA